MVLLRPSRQILASANLRPQQFPSTPLPIHYSSAVLTIDAIYSELVTALLKKQIKTPNREIKMSITGRMNYCYIHPALLCLAQFHCTAKWITLDIITQYNHSLSADLTHYKSVMKSSTLCDAVWQHWDY
jgi:hypothetical protein